MAIFFAITGGLTSIGPLAGGYLVEIDLAGDLLGQHPGRDHRPRPHRDRQARRTRSTRRRSTTAARCWSPAAWALAVLGLQQSSVWGWGSADHLDLHRRRPRDPAGRLRPLRAARREPADPGADLRRPRLRGRQRGPLPADDPLRPALLLRQHVRADLARRKRLGNRALPADLLRRLRHRLAVGRQDPRPGRGPALGGARLRGRRGRLRALGALAARPLGQLAVVLHRPRRGRRRPRPRPGQHRRPQPGAARAATARRPGSPRRCATSAPASAWRCSARS